MLSSVRYLSYPHAHRNIEPDDYNRWHHQGDDRVDSRRQTDPHHEAHARHAQVTAIGERDDAIGPRREGVQTERGGGERDDDDVGLTSCAPQVLLERVEHDDVTLDGEADHDPHGQKTARVRQVHGQLTPADAVHQAHVDAAEPGDEQTQQEERVSDVEESQVDVRRLQAEVGAHEHEEGQHVSHRSHHDDQRQREHVERAHNPLQRLHAIGRSLATVQLVGGVIVQ